MEGFNSGAVGDLIGKRKKKIISSLLSFFILCMNLAPIFTVSVQAEISSAENTDDSEKHFHSADYNPQDWRISLSELLRYRFTIVVDTIVIQAEKMDII